MIAPTMMPGYHMLFIPIFEYVPEVQENDITDGHQIFCNCVRPYSPQCKKDAYAAFDRHQQWEKENEQRHTARSNSV